MQALYVNILLKCLPPNQAIVPHRGGSICMKLHVFGQIIVNLSQSRVPCYKNYKTIQRFIFKLLNECGVSFFEGFILVWTSAFYLHGLDMCFCCLVLFCIFQFLLGSQILFAVVFYLFTVLRNYLQSCMAIALLCYYSQCLIIPFCKTAQIFTLLQNFSLCCITFHFAAKLFALLHNFHFAA